MAPGIVDRVTNLELSSVIQTHTGEIAVGIVVIIVLIGLVFIRRGYRNGHSLIIEMIDGPINRLSKLYPAWIHVHSTVVTAVAALLAYLLFIPLTNRLIVNITAVYATILFFNTSLNNRVPLLSATFKNNPKSMASATDLTSDDATGRAIKQKIEIENHGDKQAESIELKYRVIHNEEILQPWNSVDVDQSMLSHDESFTQEVLLQVVPTDVTVQRKYIVEAKLKPSVREGHLMIWRFHEAEVEIGDAEE